MPWNGSGTYTLPGNSLSPTATPGSTIVSADFNELTNDLQTAMTTCITGDGINHVVTADLPMATKKHTGVGDAAALDQYASANQVVDNTLTYGTSTTGNDTYVVSLGLNPGAYVEGNRFQFTPNAGNTGACTVNFDSIGVKNIKMANGDDPIDGAIQADVPCDVMYDGTSFILMNPYPTYLDAAAGTLVSSAALLAPGNEDEVLTIVSGVPAYAAPADQGLVSSGANFTTTGSLTLGEATNIPSTASQVIVSFVNLSINGSGGVYIELGDSAYSYTAHQDVAVYDTTQNTAIEKHIISTPSGGTDTVWGTLTFTKINGTNSWSCSGTSYTTGDDPYYIAGGFTATGVVDRVRITSTASNFLNGTASVYWT